VRKADGTRRARDGEGGAGGAGDEHGGLMEGFGGVRRSGQSKAE
jgi:hypothetical protein